MTSTTRVFAIVALGFMATAALPGCARTAAAPAQRIFATPEEGVKALAEAVRTGSLDEVRAIFGPDANDLIDSSDAATARQSREVFAAAYRERWRLEPLGPASKTLVIGNEDWPFPIPLVADGGGWRFDTAAGKEEVLARRIGRNELAAIRICRTYVTAQRLYARQGHDGQPAGLFAQAFHSDPGRENGLYWPVRAGQKRSPLGDLVAAAAQDGRVPAEKGAQPAPFHGYYFRILTGQGPAAAGGALNYIVGGRMSGGFALVAWPASYDLTGVMTFIVGRDGVVLEKDLGPETPDLIRAMTLYNPDSSWRPSPAPSERYP